MDKKLGPIIAIVIAAVLSITVGSLYKLEAQAPTSDTLQWENKAGYGVFIVETSYYQNIYVVMIDKIGLSDDGLTTKFVGTIRETRTSALERLEVTVHFIDKDLSECSIAVLTDHIERLENTVCADSIEHVDFEGSTHYTHYVADFNWGLNWPASG